LSSKHLQVFLGFDPREAAAFAVARSSIRQFDSHIPIHGLVLSDLQAKGLYYRPTERRLGKLWDVISAAPMSTEFAISRFLVPSIVKKWNQGFHSVDGWALFMDCDMLVRTNLNVLHQQLDDTKAVMCVKHNHQPKDGTKMDGQVQTAYPRKNWSSVLAFNVDHPSNKALNVEMVNTLPGRDLHRLCWLDDDEIGELDQSWNWLVGHSDPEIDPDIVHYTDGIPTFEGYRNVAFADEWMRELERWAV
jgi:hypothetical protein